MKKRVFIIAVAAVVICSLTSLATVAIYKNVEDKTAGSQYAEKVPVSFASMANTQISPTDLTVAAERTVHSVVHVKVKVKQQRQRMGGFNDPFFEFFFGQPMPSQEYEAPEAMGSGSGVIISADGYIVTNNHVIDKATEIEVTLNDKRTFSAEVIGVDKSTDIALIKIDAKDLDPIVFGNSDNLKIGEWVLAIGNPFNLTSTVTAGIISAKARSINILSQERSIESFIQTDAAINPGNSGGALVNSAGELVGINTAIASQTGSYAGYAFAVPTTIVSKVVSDLKQYGVVQRAVLGAYIANIDNKLAKEKDLETLNGVYVAGIQEGSSAEDAGLKEGDVITAIGSANVKSVAELHEHIASYRPGDDVQITIMRGNQEKVLSLKFKNISGNTDIVKNVDLAELGATFQPISEQLKRRLYINGNGGLEVKSVSRGGKFAKAGITKGFVLLKVNNKIVSSEEDIMEAYSEAVGRSDADKVLFITGIDTDGAVAHYIVDLK